jgi:hypothetical protein
MNELRQHLQKLLLADDYFVIVRADVVCDLSRIR